MLWSDRCLQAPPGPVGGRCAQPLVPSKLLAACCAGVVPDELQGYSLSTVPWYTCTYSSYGIAVPWYVFEIKLYYTCMYEQCTYACVYEEKRESVRTRVLLSTYKCMCISIPS
jgi:hypothetical protein